MQHSKANSKTNEKLDITHCALTFTNEKARDNYSIIKMQAKHTQGDSASEKIYYLSSKYSPVKEAKRIIEEHKTKQANLDKEANDVDEGNDSIQIVICLGGGNIALVAELLRHFNTAMVLVIDNHDFILDAIKEQLGANAQLHLFNEENYAEKSKYLFDRVPTRKVIFFYNRLQLQLFSDFYKKAQITIKEIHDKKSINIATLARFEKLWLRNLSHNTVKIIEAAPFSLFKEAFQTHPMLVVGAGPSLALDLPLIKKNQSHYLIVALDTAYKVLLNNHIQVDILITVDPQKINSQYLENVGEDEWQKTIVVSEPAVSPKGIRHFDHLVMFDTIFPYYNYLKDFFGAKGTIDMGGSVATAAYELLQIARPPHATFSGLDFCYTNDQYHLPGTMYEELWFSNTKKINTFEMMTYKLFEYEYLAKATTVQNKPCLIDSKFNLFKSWFEQKLKSNTLSLYNSSQLAIVIEKLPFLSFKSFVEKHASMPLNKEKILTSLKEKIRAHRIDIKANQKKLFKANLSLIKESLLEHSQQAKQAYQSAENILIKIRQGKNYLADRQVLEQVDDYFKTPLIGKDMINIVLQDVLQQIEGNKKLKLSSVVAEVEKLSEEAKPYASSKLLYEAILNASSLNIRCFERACQLLS